MTNAGAITGTSIKATTSTIGSTISQNNIYTVAKRQTGIPLTPSTVLIYTINKSAAFDYAAAMIEIVVGGITNGNSSSFRTSRFSLRRNDTSTLIVTSISTFSDGPAPNIILTPISSTQIQFRMSSSVTSSWDGTIFVTLWNGTGQDSAGTWTIT